MTGADIFGVYRTTLAIVFGCYAIVRTARTLWHWQVGTRRAGRREALMRRFLLTSVVRVRLRRFWFDLVQIAVLLAVFAYLVALQSPIEKGRASARSAAVASPPDRQAIP